MASIVAWALAGADQIGGGAGAEQQADGLDEDRLARAGLAGQDVEAAARTRPRRPRSPQGCGCGGSAACGRNFHRIIRLTAFWTRATLPCLRCPSGALPMLSEASLHTLGTLVLALQVQEGAAPLAGSGNVIELVRETGPVNQAVLVILVLLSDRVVGHHPAEGAGRIASIAAAERARSSTSSAGAAKFSEVQAVCPSLPASPLVGVFQAGYAELNAQFRLTGAASPANPGAPAPRPILKSLAAVDRALLRASAVGGEQAREAGDVPGDHRQRGAVHRALRHGVGHHDHLRPHRRDRVDEPGDRRARASPTR